MFNRVNYAKKKDKQAQIAFIKDESVRKDDMYKSHQVHVPSGEPAGSLSRPPAKRKAAAVRPITQGKLLRAGGPSDVGVEPVTHGETCMLTSDYRNPSQHQGRNQLRNRYPASPLLLQQQLRRYLRLQPRQGQLPRYQLQEQHPRRHRRPLRSLVRQICTRPNSPLPGKRAR